MFVVLPSPVSLHVVLLSYFGIFFSSSVCVCVCLACVCVCVKQQFGLGIAWGWMMWIDSCNPEQIKRALILAMIT